MDSQTIKLWEVYYALSLQLIKAGYKPDTVEKIITRPDKMNLLPEISVLRKHKKVFEKIKWCKHSNGIVFPFHTDNGNFPFNFLIDADETTMTVEWEK